MRWALSSSLRFGRLVIALAIGLVIVGVTQLRHASVDVYPQFTPPSVEVQTEALGLSAAEVEQLITVPLEQDLLNGVPWLDHIHSASMPGLSAIDLTFKRGTNIYAARQMVQERMTQAHALPNVGSPPIMIEPLASASRVAMIGLSSRHVSLVDMSVLARWKIRPKLMGVPGVANVSIYGQRDRQLQVRVDPQHLAAKGVSLTQVIETTGNALWVSPLTFVEASTPGTGGFVESPNQRLPVQHISPISTPQQLSQVPVEGHSSHELRLGDVSDVVVNHQPVIGDAVGRGAPGLFLVIEKFPGANTLEVTRGVEKALNEMGPGLKDVKVDSSVYRPASYIQSGLHNVGFVALGGLVLLVAAVLLLFASWRAALIALVVVPVSLLAAALVLTALGTTFSTITLVGIAAAVGLIVDDVVTDIDAVRRRSARRREVHEPADDTMLAAFSTSRGPLTFATLAILIATIPFLLMSQLTTMFSSQLVLAYALAVLASMVVAFSLTPALASLLLRGVKAGRDGPFVAAVTRLADRVLSVAKLRRGRAWAAVGVAAVALIAIAAPQIGGRSLLPPLQDRNLLLQVHTVTGTSLPEMDRIVASAGRELSTVPGVKDLGAHVGRAVGSDQLVDVNSAEMWITIANDADYGRTKSAIQAVMRGYPGLSAHLGSYPSDRVAQVASDDASDLVVRVYGADLDMLQHKAHDVQTMLTGVPGVARPAVHPIPRAASADIRVKLPAAQRYGLRPGDVRRDATTLTSGLIVGNLYEQAKIFDVVVWGAPQARSDLTRLGDLLIDTPSGRQVPLKDVATVRVAAEPASIIHDGVERDVAVTAKVTGDPSEVVAAVRSRLAAMPMPYEYHAEVSGQATVERASLTRTLAASAAALIVVLLLMQAAVASWRRAGLMLASLPLSVLGGVVIAPLVGGVWNAGSLAGLFAVFALAIRSSILLGRRILETERGGHADGPAAVLDAARARAVPLLQSAVVTAVALLPAAVFGAQAGLELLRPLAVTVLGGLVSLVLVQGYLLPMLLASAARRHAGQVSQPIQATRQSAD
jgi:Cu/Ag efflux pump CusA